MKRLLFSIFLSMTWLFSVGQGTIVTSPPLINNNGQSGITFQVSSNTPTEITGINCLLNNGVTSADVWIRIGGVTAGGSPSITTADGWTQVVTGGAVTGANGTALAPITIATPIQIPANTPVGVFIGAGLSYQSGTAADQVIYSDGTFTVNVADSVAYGGGAPSPTFNPRRFLGSVTYALAVTGNCTPFTNFQIDSISADAAKVDWTPGSGNTGYKLEYGPAGFTPGSGTTVTGTYPTTPATPPVVLTGLTANTNYDVYFEEYCAGPDTVAFPTPQTFTTTKLCASPTAFTDSNLTSSSVDLGWAQAGSFNNSWVIYGPAGTTPGGTGWNTVIVPAPATTYTLTGLSPSTAYDIYLATDCGTTNGVSDTVGPIAITTPIQGPQGLTCTTGSPGVLFADDFENQGGWTGDIGTGASNWNYNTGGTGSSGTGPGSAHSGSTYIYTETSGAASGANIEAISPRIDLSSSFNSAELSFWLHAYGAGIDTVKVQVGSSATGPWTTVFTNVGQIQTANNDPWQNVGVNLDSYVGSAIHLRFLVVHGSSFTGDVGIDLVEVNSCQTCPFPGNPNLLFVNSDSASIAWSGSGTKYDINWGPAGFTQGSAASNFDSTSTTSFGLGGLMGNTGYDVYIRNNCSDSANGLSGWVGPLRFVTLCNPLTAPYSNNFDTDSIDQAPICWDNAIIGGSSATFPNADVEAYVNAQSSPNVVRFYNYNTDTTMLISPQFSDMSAGDKRINFFAMTNTTATGNDLEIGTMASPGDRSSYVAIDTVTVTNSMGQFFVELTTANGYNGTHEFVAFRHIGPTFRTYYIDDFNYEQIPLCNPPLQTSLGVSGVGVSTANGFWASGSDGDATIIEWGATGFTPGASSGIGRDTVGGNVDTYTMTGMAAQTTYDFYIADSCSGNGLSPWVGPFTFTTACNVLLAPYLEDFDGPTWVASGNNAGNSLDPCWSSDPDVSNGGEPFKWIPRSTGPTSGNGPLNDLTGGNFMYVEASGSSAGDSAFLYTPLINVSTLSAPALYFWQHRFYTTTSTTGLADMRIDVTNDFGASWSTVYNTSGNLQTSNSAPWQDEFVNLPQFVGDTIQIRFVQLGQGCCGDAAIDSVAIAEAPSCPDPSAVLESNLSDTAVTVSWASALSTQNNEFWIGPAGFYQGTTTTTGTKVNLGTASSITVDTLAPQTCYEYLIRTACGPGDTSQWVGPFSFCTTCPLGFTLPYFTDFENNSPGLASGTPEGWTNCWTHQSATGATVRWEAEDASGANENSTGTGPFTDATLAPASGGIYMYLETSTSGSYADLISPGIDLNNATNPQVEFSYHMYGATMNKLVLLAENLSTGTVTALDSIVGQQQTAGSDPWNTHITNVSSLPAGNYKFIFRGYRGTSFTGDMAVDDVWVMEAPTCPRPAGLVQDSSNLNTITASWTSNGTGTSWEIEYGPAGFTPGTGTTVIANSNPYTITGLPSATSYDVYVREICGPADTSLRVGPTVMNTTLCLASDQCWTPIDLEDTFGDGWNGATLDVIQNGVLVATLGSNFTTGNLFQDSVLLCNNLTTVFVLSNAGGWPSEIGITVYTPWGTQAGQYVANPSTAAGDTLVAITAQCTPPTCPQPSNLMVNSVTGTTANLGWTNGGSGTSWEVEYGTGSFLPGAGTRVAAATNPYTLTGLSGSTNYNFYVREICGPGDTSVWAGPMNFATACVTATAPYFTDFENIPIGVGTGSPNTWGNCWTAVNSTFNWESEDASGANENSLNTGPFTDATLHPASGGTYMYIETSASGTGPSELFSPAIDFSSLTTPELKFHYHMHGATINKLVIQAEDINGNRTALDSLVGQQQVNQSDSFFVHTIDLSVLPQTTYTFVFQGYRGTSFTGDIAIDDVSVDNQGGGGTSCPMPMNAVATSNVGCDSVEVDWMSNTGGSIIEYGPAGFTPGTGTSTGIVTAPYTIYGLTPGTAYDVWIADTCSGDTSAYAPINVSTASGPLPVATISNVSDTIVGNQFRVFLDASGSTNATSYSWDFGNGVTGSGVRDTIIFLGNGTYNVVLTATNGCGSDTASFQVYVNIGLDENPLANNLNVFPNPASHTVNVSFREVGSGDVSIILRDAQGREVIALQDRMESGKYSKDIDVSSLARGIYMVEVKSGGLTAHRRLSIR